MKNRGLVATIIIMSGIIVMLLVTLLLIKMPSIVVLQTLKDKVVKKTEETTTIKATEPSTEPTTVEKEKPKAHVVNYEGYNGSVNIEYPEITGMDDLDLQERLNFKIKANALSIVPLYPISTALQKLNITCEVKSMDDKYITILYSGRVVGNSVKSSSGTSYSSSASSQGSSSKKSSSNDPYLNGFVDPLAGAGTVTTPPTYNTNAPLPLPTTTEGFQVTATPVDNTPKNNTQGSANTNTVNQISGVTEGGSGIIANNTVGKSSDNSSTSDTGPVTTIIVAPSKKGTTPVTSVEGVGPVDTTGAGSFYSDGTVLQSNSNIGPTVSASNAPTASSNYGNVSTNAPIYAHAGSNTSASTVDQKIFYTNTIDLKKCIDISLKDYADIETLAKYARSSKVEFENIEDSKKSEVRKYINKTVLSKLIEQMNEADFRNVELKAWPKHFSYRGEDGTIYFTIKLSSKLGNYAIVKYKK